MKNLRDKYTAHDIRSRFYTQDDSIRIEEMDIFYKPDILTITRKLMVKEFEIKCSWQDLKSELDVIDWVRSPEAKHRPNDWRLFERETRYIDSNKESKHFRYLIDRKEKQYAPNLFYFILPKDLYEKAKERLKGLPYGVIEADYFTTLKKPKRLHSECKRITDREFLKLMRLFVEMGLLDGENLRVVDIMETTFAVESVSYSDKEQTIWVKQ